LILGKFIIICLAIASFNLHFVIILLFEIDIGKYKNIFFELLFLCDF